MLRWNDPLNNKDELTEVAEFLGFDDTSGMITELLATELEGDITQLTFYVNHVVEQKQKEAAAAAAKMLMEAEHNNVPLFAFREGIFDDIIAAVINVLNGKVASPTQQSRRTKRTISGYTFCDIPVKVSTFSGMVQKVIKELQDMYPDDAVDKLTHVNGRITSHRPDNKKVAKVGDVFINLHGSATEMEKLAFKCIKAFGHPDEDLQILS